MRKSNADLHVNFTDTTNMQNIKIKSIEIKPISFPILHPFSNHLRTVNTSDGLVCFIETNSGIRGQGLVYGLGEIDQKIVADHVNNFVARIIHQTFTSPKQIWDIMFNAGLSSSFELNNVISVIDIAIWDIYLKEKNMSLQQIFNNARTSIQVYDTAGWLSLSQKELIDVCQKNILRGVHAFKIRLGHKNDYERIAALRKAMGNEYMLMADANQRYNTDEAITIIKNLAEFNLKWIEEPVGDSIDDLKKVTAHSKIPIAIGENINSKIIFKTICENKLANYLQPDIRKLMGLTGFIETCELIHKYDVPICSHLMPELSSSLIAGSPNGFTVEYLDIVPSDCFTHDFSIKNGKIDVPTIIGTGVELTNEAIKKFCAF